MVVESRKLARENSLTPRNMQSLTLQLVTSNTIDDSQPSALALAAGLDEYETVREAKQQADRRARLEAMKK